MEEIHTFKKIKDRHNKLFNDYKIKQIMLNELQQRYLSKECEKYTFYPIINNYIIKYNRPYFPNIPNTEIYYNDVNLSYKYFNDTNNTNKTKNYSSIPKDINLSYTYINNDNNKSTKKSLHKKNGCLISLEDCNNINKINLYHKIDNYNLQSHMKDYNLYEHKTNLFPKKINIINDPNSKYRYNLSENNKMIQKTNSIKTFFSNYSPIIKKSNINKQKYKNKNEKKDVNNIIKINIPLEELNNYRKKTYINTVHSSNNYLSKSKDFKNVYNYNRMNNPEGISLKYLIDNEKAKNNSKPKKIKNISKDKVNKIINNLFNKKYKNLFRIGTHEEKIDLNENPNNIKLKAYNYSVLEDNYKIVNKKIKTENNYKKLNVNNKFSRINTEKSHKTGNNIFGDSRTINLTEKQSRQNRKYYDKNTYNKKCITSIVQNDNLSTLKHNKTSNKGYDYTLNLNSKIILKSNKNISTKIKNNKKTKDKSIPIPITSNNKLLILNKISESKKGMKNILMNKANFQKYILKNKYKYNKMTDFNQTNNEETYKSELLSRENKLNTISDNTQSIDRDNNKNIISFIEKKFNNKNYNRINNKIFINRKNRYKNESINNINSFKLEAQKKENKNKNIIRNEYKISNKETNEYHSNYKNKKIKEKDLNENSDISIESLSDSKILEIANTYVDEQVDKIQVSGILSYKKKQNQFS